MVPEKEKRLCKEAFLYLVIEGLAAGETHLAVLSLGGAALGADFLISECKYIIKDSLRHH